MMKIKSTKAFKDAVDVAFDTQTKRDRKKREYDEQRKSGIPRCSTPARTAGRAKARPTA